MCIYDEDVQKFLNENALKYEERNWGRTYLVLNAPLDEFLNDENSKIEGYFTLNLKAINFPENTSNSLRKKINKGLNKSIEQENCFPCVLIGQLGKYISEDYVSPLERSKLLELAFYLTRKVNEIVPMDCVILDTRKNKKVNDFYIRNGFMLFDSTDEFDTFIKTVKAND